MRSVSRPGRSRPLRPSMVSPCSAAHSTSMRVSTFLPPATLATASRSSANRQFWTAFFTALPDLTATMEDLVISGDRVVGRFTYRGTHTSAFMGIPASGNPVEMRSIDIWRVEDGMFAEHWDELNLLEMFQQMGALPPLGAGPERDA